MRHYFLEDEEITVESIEFEWYPTSAEIEKELNGGKSREHEQGQDQVSCKVPDEMMPANVNEECTHIWHRTSLYIPKKGNIVIYAGRYNIQPVIQRGRIMTFETWWKMKNKELQNKNFTVMGIARVAWDAGKNSYRTELKTIYTTEDFPEDTDCCSSGQ